MRKEQESGGCGGGEIKPLDALKQLVESLERQCLGLKSEVEKKEETR